MNKTERYHFYRLLVGILGAWVLIGVNATSADERRRGDTLYNNAGAG